MRDVGVERIVRLVFERIDLDPDLATKRTQAGQGITRERIGGVLLGREDGMPTRDPGRRGTVVTKFDVFG